MSPSTVISFQYDDWAFQAGETEELAAVLSEFAPTRARKAYKERGGDETTLWLTVTWIGSAFVSGLIGHLAGKAYERLVDTLQRFYTTRRKIEPRYAQAIALTLSYDDIDIEINLPGEITASFMVNLLTKVHEHLQKGSLTETSFPTQIRIPYKYMPDEHKWMQNYVWDPSEYDCRFWGLSYHGMPVCHGDL